MTITSIRPEAIREPEAGRRQVERDGLAGDEVVVGERGELGRGSREIGPGPLDPVSHGRHATATAYVAGVDLDAYVHAHVHEWRRLEELTRRRRLTGPESDELVERYQQVATHLSVVRTSAPDASLVAYLSSLLGRARTRSVGTRTHRGARRPASSPSSSRPRSTGCATGGWARWPPTSWSPAVMIWWLLGNPGVEQTLISPEQVDQLVNEDFENYYSENAASHFAPRSGSTTPGCRALCLALGILGLPVDLPAVPERR